MKYSITILFLAIRSFAQAQTTVLTTDASLPIPKLSFDEKADLKITALATSSPNDFDFLVGKWKMHNRRLNKRLENCKDWTEFDSSDENFKTLSAAADMDIYSTTNMPGTRIARFGARRFLPTTAKHGNGIGITCRSESLNRSCLLGSCSRFRMTKLT
jgi:hypothetical protein